MRVWNQASVEGHLETCVLLQLLEVEAALAYDHAQTWQNAEIGS